MLRWFAISLVVLSAPAFAQTATKPRTPDDRPDLQGAWHNLWVAPLERPVATMTLVISKAEAEAYASANQARAGVGLEAPFFGPEARTALIVRGEYRSSLIIDPPSGRLPYTAEGAKRHAAIAAQPRGTEGPEARVVTERCVGGMGRAPILPNAVGNYHEIIQTADTLVMRSDYTAEARLIPLDRRRPAIGLRQGESQGRWDGDTLVIETVNFRADDTSRTAPGALFVITPQTRITERFTRIAQDVLSYTFMVEDPTIYTQPWTGESMFGPSPYPIYEFACHEGNYSMTNILRGARMIEQREAAATTRKR